MNKHILCCVSAFVGISYSFAADFSKVIIKKDPLTTLSLRASKTQSLFSLKNDQQKEELNQKLKDKIILPESLRFDGLIVEHLDLSDMHLQHIDFSGGTFTDVKFNKADLTGAQFNKTKLTRIDLTGAILCPLDDLENPISEKTFTLKSGNHYQLVNQYSNLMKESKADQAQCLNKLFPALHLNLAYHHLENFNLTGIDLENADLFDSDLQGINLIGANFGNISLKHVNLQKAILSERVTLPNYPNNNRTEMFKLWCSNDPEYQQVYQKLVKLGFSLTAGVDNKTLIKGIKEKKDLRNADLSGAQLQGADLTGANLQNASLWWAELQGANLTEINLQNTNLAYAKLQGTILSEKVTLPNYPNNNRTEMFKLWCSNDPEYQQVYQKLVKLGFSLTAGVDNKTLIEGIKKQKDLRNADLQNANLQNADLTEADLQNADLSFAELQGVDLTGAKLGGTTLAIFAGSGSYKLPKDCKDEDLIGIYKSCKDQRVKPILKQILEAKKIPIE